jgi:type II secretory pathway pseudopilin PulG
MLKKSISKNEGFTTLEIMLVVALIAIVASATVGIYFTAKRRSDIDIATNVTVQYIRRAQTFSQSGKQDSQWSIHITSDEILLYKGDDYDLRDTNFDENYQFPASLTHTGLENISFTKIEGIPNITGQIYLEDSSNNISTISINSKGLVDY